MVIAPSCGADMQLQPDFQEPLSVVGDTKLEGYVMQIT